MKKQIDIEFEAGIKMLQEIIDKLENGNVTLKESIDLYEEGMRLSEFCYEELNNAKQKIEIIRNNYYKESDIEATVVEND